MGAGAAQFLRFSIHARDEVTQIAARADRGRCCCVITGLQHHAVSDQTDRFSGGRGAGQQSAGME